MSETSLKAEDRHITWYRSTIFAAYMVAGTAFFLPGIFGALNGMGAGGGASPAIANAANAIVFGVLAVGSLVVGVIANRITPKWTLLIGTLGYAPYAAGFYLVDRTHHSWLLLLGAVSCGISACFLWVASGAIFIGYNEEHRKGFATSLKFMFQNLGASIGGIISLALNAKRDYRGSISRSTYIVLLTLMCLGFPFALALPAAHKVQRTDGRKVILRRDHGLRPVLNAFWAVIRNPTILALIPLLLYYQWFLSYQWQYNFAYFTVRSRALNSLLFYLTGFISALLFGWFLDSKRLKRTTRAKIGFLVILTTVGASWILGLAVQVHYEKTQPTLDWANGEFGLGCFVFVLWGISDPLVSVFLYWIGGSLTNSANEGALIAAFFNSIGCVGSTFGFVVSAKGFSLVGACAINFGLFFLAVPGLAWVSWSRVSETSHGIGLTSLATEDDDSGSEIEQGGKQL